MELQRAVERTVRDLGEAMPGDLGHGLAVQRMHHGLAEQNAVEGLAAMVQPQP
ncbi:hypothetical protein D3C78_1053590 [compost metagenome]